MNRQYPGPGPEATFEAGFSVDADYVVGSVARILRCESSEDGDGATGGSSHKSLLCSLQYFVHKARTLTRRVSDGQW